MTTARKAIYKVGDLVNVRDHRGRLVKGRIAEVITGAPRPDARVVYFVNLLDLPRQLRYLDYEIYDIDQTQEVTA